MTPPLIRHRLVQSASRPELQRAVAKLMAEGWRTIGEPAIVSPNELHSPPYWVQPVYRSAMVIPLELQSIPPPAGSRFAEEET